MEIFNEIWVWLVAALGGISMTSIITAVIIGCLKGAFNKTISKINVEKIMTKKVVTVPESEVVANAAKLIVDNGIGYVPVMSGE